MLNQIFHFQEGNLYPELQAGLLQGNVTCLYPWKTKELWKTCCDHYGVCACTYKNLFLLRKEKLKKLKNSWMEKPWCTDGNQQQTTCSNPFMTLNLGHNDRWGQAPCKLTGCDHMNTTVRFQSVLMLNLKYCSGMEPSCLLAQNLHKTALECALIAW